MDVGFKATLVVALLWLIPATGLAQTTEEEEGDSGDTAEQPAGEDGTEEEAPATGEEASAAGDEAPAVEEVAAPEPAKPAPAPARDRKAALIFGPLDSNVDRGAVEALLASRLAKDAVLPGRTTRLGEIPIPAGEPLWVLGSTGDELCRDGGIAPDWASVIDTARGQLDSLETAAAQTTLQEALANLACSDTVVEREILGQLYMFRGLAQFFEGGEEAARQDFRRAVTVNPKLEWDSSYPPAPQQAYLKAREDIYLQGRARVEAMFLPGEVVQVVVDGESFAAGEAGGLDVHPGHHLVQYMMPDQALISRVTFLEGGESRLIVSRAGSEQIILLGGSDPANAPQARVLLNELCSTWNVEKIYVADVSTGAGDEAYVYRFSAQGAKFEKLLPPATEVADTDVDVETVEPRSTVEGLLVLPNAVAEGSTATISAESTHLDGSERLYLGEYEVRNFKQSGVRNTFSLPDKISAGVYDVRIVKQDGAVITFPRAFSVIGDSSSQPTIVVVTTGQPDLKPEPEERLRLGFKWGFAYYRGTWGTMDLEMDVRLGEGFCLDGAVGTRVVEGYYPHAYWRAGFKVRWYPKIIQGYFTVNFQHFIEDQDMGPRAAVGVDIVIPSMKSFYMSFEAGGGVMFETSRDLYGWFHLQGGTGMRF